jgi:predicted dehydrogenase
MEQLKWGLVGGGEGSQIGPAHRLATRIDGRFDFVAGALDHRAEEGRKFGQQLGLHASRAYGSWRDMLEGERSHPDRLDLVTIATPNATHFEITKAWLEAGFHVLCEKPLTVTVEEADEIVRLSEKTKRICAVNYGYTGYPLVRHLRAMVARGDLGRVRMVFAEFAHGHHADAADADNPRVRWRYDPAQVGVSAQFADCGIHALHMASFVTGQEVETLSADTASLIASRQLEDDAMVNFRMSGGTVGRLWTSSVAIGRQHGLAIQVFGEKGGVRWEQEHPDQLRWTPLGGRTSVIERGEKNLSPEADRATRITIGHAEGMPLAFANIYADLADTIIAMKHGKPVAAEASQFPQADAGLRSIAAIYAVAESGKAKGQWVEARPMRYR